MARKPDLEGLDALFALDWPSRKRELLITLFERVRAQATKATNWYLVDREGLKNATGWVRVIVVVSALAAATLPILAGIWPWLPATLATVAVAIATAAIGLDKHLGLTSRRVRYMTTGMALTKLGNGFVMDCQKDRAKWPASDPIGEDLMNASIERCRAFVAEIDQTVLDETRQWAAEFLDVMKQLEASVKASEATARLGAIQVVVTNYKACEAPGWTVSVDSGAADPPRTHESATITGLPPGIRKVLVRGTLTGGKVAGAEQPVDVKGGATASVSVTLT